MRECHTVSTSSPWVGLTLGRNGTGGGSTFKSLHAEWTNCCCAQQKKSFFSVFDNFFAKAFFVIPYFKKNVKFTIDFSYSVVNALAWRKVKIDFQKLAWPKRAIPAFQLRGQGVLPTPRTLCLQPATLVCLRQWQIIGLLLVILFFSFSRMVG